MVIFYCKGLLMKNLPEGFSRHVEETIKDAQQIEGHLTLKEIRFLCLLATVPTTKGEILEICLLYTSPSPRDATLSRMPSSA